MPGLPVNAPTDALLTIVPLPWRSICRSSCFMQLHTPRKLTPITRSQSSRVLSAVGAIRAMTPSYMQEPSLCVIAQGVKRVLLGDDTYMLDVHHFLITSVDLRKRSRGKLVENQRVNFLGFAHRLC